MFTALGLCTDLNSGAQSCTSPQKRFLASELCWQLTLAAMLRQKVMTSTSEKMYQKRFTEL